MTMGTQDTGPYAAMRNLSARTKLWVVSRFGEGAMDRQERATRVLEEAIELAQAEGVGEARAKRLMEHVYSRPKGEPNQEAAGTMVCLLAWAAAANYNLYGLAITELCRIESYSVEYFQKRLKAKSDAGLAKPMDIADEEA